MGADFVHSYVGYEPSGRLFNEICLDGNGELVVGMDCTLNVFVFREATQPND